MNKLKLFSNLDIYILIGGGDKVQNLRLEYKQQKNCVENLNQLETYYHFRAIEFMTENAKSFFSFLKQIINNYNLNNLNIKILNLYENNSGNFNFNENLNSKNIEFNIIYQIFIH